MVNSQQEHINSSNSRSQMKINKPKSQYELLTQTQELLESAKPDEYGRLRPSSAVEYFDIAVTISSLPRAIKLFQSLLTELEKRGYSLSITKNPQPYAYSRPWITKVNVSGYDVDIKLEEPTHRKRRELTKQEQKQSYLYGQYTYSPSGKLVLLIDDSSGEATKKWSDSKSARVEERISSFIETLEITASAGKIRDIESQKWHENYERARRAEMQEASRVQKLDSMLKSWKTSQDISNLAKHLQMGITNAKLPEEKEKPIHQWIRWMKQRSVALDPLEKIIDLSFE